MKKLFLILVVLILGTAVFAQTQAGGLYILFPPNSANLRAVDTAQAVINHQAFTQLARQMSENPQIRVVIDGHANAVLGTNREEMNVLRPLSYRRAEAAANFLVSYFNIDQQRLIIAGAGGGFPSSSTDGSLNRRVSFIIIR